MKFIAESWTAHRKLFIEGPLWPNYKKFIFTAGIYIIQLNTFMGFAGRKSDFLNIGFKKYADFLSQPLSSISNCTTTLSEIQAILYLVDLVVLLFAYLLLTYNMIQNINNL